MDPVQFVPFYFKCKDYFSLDDFDAWDASKGESSKEYIPRRVTRGLSFAGKKSSVSLIALQILIKLKSSQDQYIYSEKPDKNPGATGLKFLKRGYLLIFLEILRCVIF